ncbi:hypothetical protein DPMN_036707 [Dreissena polymorpha]|uniref:Uncharacterized protein n=1 Tax=Dreissena polymorpha TaxID=45954 RepID=A0A9D4M9L7_DREPO|nr:hypothetical protein DPMN_036707 [Dreissena polymorpha]
MYTIHAVGDDDCDYDKDCNADTDNSDDDNVYDVYDSCEEDDNGDNDDGDCAMWGYMTLKVTILISSRLKGDGRPSWNLIVELKTATERQEQGEHPLNLKQNWTIF